LCSPKNAEFILVIKSRLEQEGKRIKIAGLIDRYYLDDPQQSIGF